MDSARQRSSNVVVVDFQARRTHAPAPAPIAILGSSPAIRITRALLDGLRFHTAAPETLLCANQRPSLVIADLELAAGAGWPDVPRIVIAQLRHADLPPVRCDALLTVPYRPADLVEAVKRLMATSAAP